MHNARLDLVQEDSLCSQLSPRVEDSYVAIDVETANTDISSICQIAVVDFVSGRVKDVWNSLINPEAAFATFNVSLHGIDASAVEDAPDFPMVAETLTTLLSDRVVASHMPFDRLSLERACLKHGIPPIKCRWLDTARIVRRAWPRFAKRGYGLKSVASWCGIEFRHHDAVEDANAAGRILAMAVAETGITLEGWLHCSPQANTRTCPTRHQNCQADRRLRRNRPESEL